MKKIVIALAILVLAWIINRPDDMPRAQLDSYKNARLQQKRVDVGGACGQEKCLTIYVAPWCPSCSALTPMINNLVRDLKRDGISATVVIGQDSMSKVLDYSKKYDASVLADPNGNYFDKLSARGVPYFAVSDRYGKRISDMAGGSTNVGRMRDQLDL